MPAWRREIGVISRGEGKLLLIAAHTASFTGLFPSLPA
jgi:hypothetical protein